VSGRRRSVRWVIAEERVLKTDSGAVFRLVRSVSEKGERVALYVARDGVEKCVHVFAWLKGVGYLEDYRGWWEDAWPEGDGLE
jgi:hypothetical protein